MAVEDERVRFTDDAIFGDEKRRLFQLVVLLDVLEDVDDAVQELAGIDEITDEICIKEATFFIPRTSLEAVPGKKTGGIDARLFRTASGAEFEASELCLNRPSPRGYDETLMWKEMKGGKFIVLRADRFVFAACRTGEELVRAAERVGTFVESGEI